MAELSQAEQIRESILGLEQALLANNPQMPTMLRTIHSALRADPETVTLLSDEEISIVVRGLMKQTQTTIAAEVAKAKSGKAMKNMDLLDL